MAGVDDVLNLIVKTTKKAPPGARKPKAAPGAPKSRKPPPPRLKPGEYVRDRQRTAFPGIYDRPDEIAARAAANTAPESPALRELFGVTRDDLYQMSQAPRVNQSTVRLPASPRGSQAAENIITPRNTQRLIDTLAEAQKYPELSQGMAAWYNMDPARDRLRQISNNPDLAFERFNTYSGMASPGSDVMTELRRGTTARMLDEQGRMEDWIRYGGNPAARGVPEDMVGVPGHPYHPTAHVIPMEHYSRTGEIGIKAPKVPPYIQSSLPQDMGGTWTTPVGDAHFSRAVGLADTRRSQEYGGSVSTPELTTLMPWWSRIADEVGLQEVPAQATAWGTFSRETGVETPVGKPKLELLADAITRRAFELGKDPRQVRDDVLAGRERLMLPLGAGGAGLLAMSPEEEEAARAYGGGT